MTEEAPMILLRGLIQYVKLSMKTHWTVKVILDRPVCFMFLFHVSYIFSIVEDHIATDARF